jgi:hypothetical protein
VNTCETCKHWENSGLRVNQGYPYPGYGVCKRATGHSGPDEKDALAYADDAEDYEAYLRTKPNFGCVQWEAKP